MYYFERYLNIGQIRANTDIFIQDDRMFRLFLNTGANNPLANSADNRSGAPPLLTNIYSAVTNYFIESVWDELPEGDVNPNFVKEFKKATFYRSLYGFGVVARIGDRFQAIDSRFYLPILDRGEHVGHALVVPYKTPNNAQMTNTSQNLNANLPDRAWTVQLLNNADTAVIMDFEYNGITLGRKLNTGSQEQISIAVFGNGVKDYELIEPVVNTYNEMMVASSDIISRHSKPHMQVPASAVRPDDAGNPSIWIDPNGTIMPVNRDDKDWKYLTLETNVQLFDFQARQLLGVLSAITSVPLATFNIHGLPRLESGDAVNAVEAPAHSKVKQWRLEIIDAADTVGVQIEWVYESPVTETQDEPNDE